jgi:hypothetical protein
MSRKFSVIRRRPNLVDIVTPFVYGVDLYRLKKALNFDGVFAQFLDAPNVGFCDPAVDRNTLEVHQTNGMVRVTFDPRTYGITDTLPLWLELAHDIGGVETVLSPPTLLLPEAAHHGIYPVTIAGAAPNGASVANSLQIDLPRLMSDIRISNHGLKAGPLLYVATEPGGAETAVPPAVDSGQATLTINGSADTLLVRGDGAVVDFSAVLTASFPR